MKRASNRGAIADGIRRVLSTLKLTTLKADRARLGKVDLGALTVALMVAALDGEILPSEVQAFEDLAKRSRGYTAKAFLAAKERAFRSAGYLTILSKSSTHDELLRAFVDEALAVMPDGFACGSLQDVRRAFVMWVAMGVSDGDFSAIEREAIEALRRTFAEIKRSRAAADFDRWAALSPTFRQAVGTSKARDIKVVLVDEAFIARAEKAVKGLGRADTAKAEADIQSLICEG